MDDEDEVIGHQYSYGGGEVTVCRGSGYASVRVEGDGFYAEVRVEIDRARSLFKKLHEELGDP